jgi:hypothetical protein
MRRWVLAIIGLACQLGCQTQFIGSAHITPEACAAKCTESHLQMAGMVYLGEYSSACVCETIKPPDAATPGVAMNAAPGALGASAGVMMQMERERQQQGTQSRQPYSPPPPPSFPR